MANTVCPICNNTNECMMNNPESKNCWCYSEQFPEKIFDLIPAESLGKHCICKGCLDQFVQHMKGK